MPADAPYSNRELDRIFKGHEDRMMAGFAAVSEQIHDVIKVAERIEQQTIRTNGRVSNLESWRENLKGAWRLITWVGIPLLAVWVGFVSWSTTELLKLKDTVQNTPDLVEKAVANELSKVELQVTE